MKTDNNWIYWIIGIIAVVFLLYNTGILKLGSVVSPDEPSMAMYDNFDYSVNCKNGYIKMQEIINSNVVQRMAASIYCEDANNLFISKYDYAIKYLWEYSNLLGSPSDLNIAFNTLLSNVQYRFITIATANECGSTVSESTGYGYYIMKQPSDSWDVKTYLSTVYPYYVEVGYVQALPNVSNYDAYNDSANFQCNSNSCGGSQTSIDKWGCPIYSGTCDAGYWYFTGASNCYDPQCGCQSPQFIGCQGYKTCTSSPSSSGVCGSWVRQTQGCTCGGSSFKYPDQGNFLLEKKDYIGSVDFHSLGSFLISKSSTIEIQRNLINSTSFLIKVNGQTVQNVQMSQAMDNFHFALKFNNGASTDYCSGCGTPRCIVEPKLDKVFYKVPFESCTVNTGEVVVRDEFAYGSIIDIKSLKYPLKRFCINNPPQILKIGVGQEAEIHGEMFTQIIQGNSITVPSGYIYKISYITNYVAGMEYSCPIGSAVINSETGECEEYASTRIDQCSVASDCYSPCEGITASCVANKCVYSGQCITQPIPESNTSGVWVLIQGIWNILWNIIKAIFGG